MRTDHGLYMTHGDGRPANIIVERRKDADAIRIKGLVDWGDSGVYPKYWEFMRALYLFKPSTEDDWFEYLPTQEIGNYIEEYFLDDLIDRLVVYHLSGSHKPILRFSSRKSGKFEHFGLSELSFVVLNMIFQG
jgi:aminoglycoside phosphotransferase